MCIRDRGIIIIIIMPIVAVVSIFNGDIDIDTGRLQAMVVENLSAEEQAKLQFVEDTMYGIEDEMTAAGFGGLRVTEAQVLFTLCLYDHAQEEGFISRLTGCFAEGQTDAQLIDAVNAAFGKMCIRDSPPSVCKTAEGGKMFKRKPKVLTPQEQEEIRTKDFFDMILPGTIKFLSDHYIVGDSYRCVWAIREYPPSTEEQAILSQLADRSGVTLRIYHRLVESMEQRKIIQNATRRNKLKSGGTDVNETIEAEGNLQDVIELLANLRKNREPLLHCSVSVSYTHLDVYKRQPVLC